MWPLPPPGPLAFVCEWPAQGIFFAEHLLDPPDDDESGGGRAFIH